jgi:hypothetical protein
MRYRTLCLLALTGVASACDLLTEPTEVVPGRIVQQEDTARIDLPDTVARGALFSVTVTTLEGGCVRRAARTEVVTTDLLAEITPYNVLVRSEFCTSDPVGIPHTARIRFTGTGLATVRIRGVSNQVRFEGQPELLDWVTLELPVVVR